MNEIVHRYYMGVQKCQQSHLQKSKVVLSEIIPEETLKKILLSLKKIKTKTKIIFVY